MNLWLTIETSLTFSPAETAMMMMMMIMRLVVLVVAAATEAALGPPLVSTEEGRISGLRERSTKGVTFYSYRSIPFAKPPAGELRFKAPVASPKWEGVRDGSVDPPACLQVPIMPLINGGKNTTGSEDCLYLNVFTPSEPGGAGEHLPVMVFIHGGAFIGGSASEYLPHVLLNHDVVLVVLQYRLGVLGFLSTEDSVIPGNFGLLDQSLALRWVQRNIGHFGGDAKRVTIFGESAGSASVHYHILSPKTEGLFSRAILQSGSALSPWAYGGSFREVAKYVGEIVGCPTHLGSQTLLQCFQESDPEALAAISTDFIVLVISPVLLAPRVDGEFLPAEPSVLLKEGKQHRVTVISGTTAHEGAFMSGKIYADEAARASLEKNFPVVGMTSLEFGADDVDPEDLANRIFLHYLGGVDLREENADLVTQIYSDRLFNVDHEQVSRLHSQVAMTYTYELTYRGQHSFSRMFGQIELYQEWVSHADDLLYLFSGGPILQFFPLATEEDLKLQDVMTQLWVNFATTGNPTPDDSLGFTWLPLSQSNLHHLNLTPTPTMAPDHRQQMMEFWSTLPTKQNLILDPERVVFSEAEKNDAKQQQQGVRDDAEHQKQQDVDDVEQQQNEKPKVGITDGTAQKKLKIPTKVPVRDEL